MPIWQLTDKNKNTSIQRTNIKQFLTPSGNIFWQIHLQMQYILTGLVRLCDKSKAYLYTHNGAQRDNSRRGSLNNILSWRPIQGAISPSKSEPAQRSTVAQCSWKPEIRTQKRGHPVWIPPKANPGQPQPLCPNMKPTQMLNTRACLGHVIGYRGRALVDCTRSVWSATQY